MPGGSEKGGGLEVGSAYKMKNSALHKSAKYGTPMQMNYGSPNKDYSVGKGSHDHPHGGSPADMHGKSPNKDRRVEMVNDPNTGTSREKPVAHDHDESPATMKSPNKDMQKYGEYDSADKKASVKAHNDGHRGIVKTEKLPKKEKNRERP